MHIAEGFLPATHCIAWAVVSTPFVIHGAKAVMEESKKSPENKLLLAAAGAFTFVLSAIKLPSVTGSSSHPTGTGFRLRFCPVGFEAEPRPSPPARPRHAEASPCPARSAS